MQTTQTIQTINQFTPKTKYLFFVKSGLLQVLASQVDQCFFITDPSKPRRVVVRRGKRNIIGMDGVANEQDFDKYGDPKMEDDYAAQDTYTTTLPKKGLPFKRKSEGVLGLNYSTTTKKGKNKIVRKRLLAR